METHQEKMSCSFYPNPLQITGIQSLGYPIFSATKGKFLLIALFLVLIAFPSSLQAQEPTEIDYIIDRGFQVTNNLERYRSLPLRVELLGKSVDPAGYFQMSIEAILQLAGINVSGQFESDWKMPDSLFPEMTLSEEIYGEMIDKQEYLSFFQSIQSSLSANAQLPSSFTFRNSDYRFVDTFYLTSHILRFYRAFGYLPSTIDPKITAPDGLFPWSIPADKRAFIGAIQNSEGSYGSKNLFYDASAMDYELYALAKEIIVGETDVFRAGRRIFIWTHSLYRQTPYGLRYDVTGGPFGFVTNSYEQIRTMHGTSGTPQRPKYGLYPAAGIPHAYGPGGYGGMVYTEEEGWFNAEFHGVYGDEISANPFLWLDDKDPLPSHPSAIPLSPDHIVVESVAETIKHEERTVEQRGFWINPSDVSEHGTEKIIQTAIDGDFNTIILTVKTFYGKLYFETGNPSHNVQFDAISALIPAAKNAGLKLLVAFNTLSDYDIGKAEEWGQRYLEEDPPLPYNEFFISPCIVEYQDYTKELIQALYANYDVDGLVLARNYVLQDAWGNSECNVGSSDEEQTAWLANFVNDLAQFAKVLDEDREVYFLTAPQLANEGYPLSGTQIDDADLNLLSQDFDGIILTFDGLSWVTNEYELWNDVNEIISSLANSVEIPVLMTSLLSKEWQYPPEFYRGLAKRFKASGAEGLFLISHVSGDGELGSAFVKQHYGKLRKLQFLADAPETRERIEVVTSTQQDYSPGIRLGQNFPNPFSSQTTIEYSLDKTTQVNLAILNLTGEEIHVLVDGLQTAGQYSINWDGKNQLGNNLADGIYLYRLRTGAFESTKKIILYR